MTQFLTNTGTIANLRFVYSPLIELTISFNTFKNEYQKQIYWRWFDDTHRAVDKLEFPLMNELILSRRESSERYRPNRHKMSSYVPDFLTPTPRQFIKNIEDEFAELLAMPDDLIRAGICTLIDVFGLTDKLCQFLINPREHLQALIIEMRDYWNRALAHHWKQMLAVVENDILHHSRILTLQGIEYLFPELSPKLEYKDNALSLQELRSHQYKVAGHHLFLAPSIFSANYVWYQMAEPWEPMLIYTPRGTGLWNQKRNPASEDLEIIIGAGKANLLMALANPLSTGELARKLNITSGAVSQHIATLHKAGLVESYRQGKYVFYRLSERGERLVSLFS